ncbi:alpha/beta fold hydrolase [Actinoplanes sp. LDG1-06]|uniref:Alpha/beta fold hydrolase n=1 Tax=Paractinoplanes ovalisporus TaxID=2810368 RepID=A0ABS2AWW2_9ACTN|nr:alpha/beta hydrolase [Actinoplanes ovalisporus]MBM2623888.1 alpha/beta fold hydrolase [Actinoplanes ovalisporus]
MTVVFVHGVPESSAIWTPLLDELEKLGVTDTVRLSPPGFGAPLPAGFIPDVDGYRDWLITELERLGEPVHLVGHDWGGAHVINVAMTRPDLLKSWTSDAIGVFDPEYVWHDLAQSWQTEGAGEAFVAQMFGAALDQKTETMMSYGIDHSTAAQIAAAQYADMGHAVLSLYRAARQPMMADLGRNLHLAQSRPGQVLIAAEDHMVGSLQQRRSAAARAGAQVEILEGVAHFWMAQKPAAAAPVLARFWASPNHE